MKKAGFLGVTFLLVVGMASATQVINAGIFKADAAYIDQIFGLTNENKVNITGLIISDGQIKGYYNRSYIEMLLGTKSNQTDLKSHENNKSNPHGVTAIHIGAYNTSEIDNMLSGKADNGHSHTIGTTNLSNNAVTGAKIKDGTITSDDIANGAVTSADINFSYAGSTSKGGIATNADKLGGMHASDFASASEVSNARGSRSSLDERLDVSLNENGTLKQSNLRYFPAAEPGIVYTSPEYDPLQFVENVALGATVTYRSAVWTNIQNINDKNRSTSAYGVKGSDRWVHLDLGQVYTAVQIYISAVSKASDDSRCDNARAYGSLKVSADNNKWLKVSNKDKMGSCSAMVNFGEYYRVNGVRYINMSLSSLGRDDYPYSYIYIYEIGILVIP